MKISGSKRVKTVPKLKARARDVHKGDCGRVLLVAGSEGMLGAAMLCASAALRGGAGLVRAALPKPLMTPFTIGVPPATTVPRTPASLKRALRDADAVVLGPGIGTTAAARSLVLKVLGSSDVPTVVDADGLYALSPASKYGSQTRRSRAALVLTPHTGEAARMLGVTSADVRADRPAALAELCRLTSAVVVLKGAGTLVGDGSRCYQNTTGNPGLATAGSGDVLAGLIGAFLADSMAPFEAACAAVYWHGKAGELVAQRLSQRGLIASDLPMAIAEVLA